MRNQPHLALRNLWIIVFSFASVERRLEAAADGFLEGFPQGVVFLHDFGCQFFHRIVERLIDAALEAFAPTLLHFTKQCWSFVHYLCDRIDDGADITLHAARGTAVALHNPRVTVLTDDLVLLAAADAGDLDLLDCLPLFMNMSSPALPSQSASDHKTRDLESRGTSELLMSLAPANICRK